MYSDEEMIAMAKEASKNAYCPYSKFPVGACALFESGKIYTGCNVENSSYGLSLCAERNAISSAIAEGETSKLIALAVYSPKSDDCFPCGACRQWVQEFSRGYNTRIILNNSSGFELFYINDLLPYSFNLV